MLHAESKLTTESWVVAADDPTAAPRSLLGRRDGHEYSVEHWGERWVMLTNDAAEDFRVVAAPEDDPRAWTELVPHSPGRRINAAEPFVGHLVIHEWADARQQLRVLFADGGERAIELGDTPAEVELGDNPEYDSTVLRFSYQSLAAPESTLRRGRRLRRTDAAQADARARGRPDPLHVVADLGHRRTTVCASRSTWSTPSTPRSTARRRRCSTATERTRSRFRRTSRSPGCPCSTAGWVFALAHPRGGGELGRRWYLDGKLLAKRNTFTDYIACAEHLVAVGAAAPGRVAVRGGSAGGLLVGAAMTIRPDVFAAVNAQVPFVDVVTSMSDPGLPLTVTEWEEWGDPRIEPFASYMLSYSPYDNVAAADYPAMYVSAGLNDPRVAYHEPAKWVAKLRALATGTRPLLLKTEMGAGHGGPSGRYDAWREEAENLAFFLATV